MKGVRPLPPSPERPAASRPPPQANQHRKGRKIVLQEALHGGPGVPDLRDADSVSYRQAGFQKKGLEQLKRGQISMKASLDLHGLTLEEASARLEAFIDEMHQAGITSFLVVHGKGLRSGPQGPVLRPAILKRLSLRQDVLAFTTARHCDGGSGATYVLLKRA